MQWMQSAVVEVEGNRVGSTAGRMSDSRYWSSPSRRFFPKTLRGPSIERSIALTARAAANFHRGN